MMADTQTQDQQNIQTTSMDTTPDLSAVDLSSEATAATPVEATAATPVETPAATPIEAPAETPIEAPAEKASILQQWVDSVKWAIWNWVQAVTDLGKQWAGKGKEFIAWWKEAVSGAITSTKEVVQDNIEIAKNSVHENVDNAKSFVQDSVQTTKGAILWVAWSAAQAIEWTVGAVDKVATGVVQWAVSATSQVINGTGNAIQGINNWIAWAILPEQQAQKVSNFQDKISQWAQNLWAQAKDKVQEAWQQAKGFLASLWDKFKKGFSVGNAKEVMQQASEPIDYSAAAPATDAWQPAAPQSTESAATWQATQNNQTPVTQPVTTVNQQNDISVQETVQPLVTSEVQPGATQQPVELNTQTPTA